MIFLFWLLLSAITSSAETLQSDHVTVSLVAPQQMSSKEPTHVGVRFVPDPEWHVYWKNPGDSGAAPKFNIKAENVKVGEIQWPVPHRLPLGDLTNLGYEGEVIFPIEVQANGGPAKITFDMEWLVCKVDCVPGFGVLTIEREVGETTIWKTTQDQANIEKFLAQVPGPSSVAPWKLEGTSLLKEAFQMNWRGPKNSSAPNVFPTDGELLFPAAPRVEPGDSPGLWTVTLARPAGREIPKATGVVLVAGNQAWEWKQISLESERPEAPASSLWFLLFSALIGGALLNLMPCVFPVLSIKVSSLVKSHGHTTREGILYSLGVIVTFAALGGGFLALRQAGAAVGWGFQLQSPIVVLLLAILFWLMALSFLGVFDFGNALMRWAGDKGGRDSSSFATGVLSVFVAAPCTGPFMGAALGASATLPPAQAMMLFLGLGVGLAAPFLVLAMSPSLLRRLPKPGPWMETFKQFLAFPMFASSLWLLWVIGQQLGDRGWLIALTSFLGFSFFLWLARHQKVVAALGFVATLVWAVFAVHTGPSSDAVVSTESGLRWATFEPMDIEKERSKGRPVFVDFTAAWCITCQWNKKSVLQTEQVEQAFVENNVYLVRADWTNYDERITEALSQFGRNSVPVYAYYPADGSPVRILPQLLSVSLITELFNNAEEESP